MHSFFMLLCGVLCHDALTFGSRWEVRGTAFLAAKCVLWVMAVRENQLRGLEAALERSYA